MRFYSSVWDPRLIVSQILTMQCLYYLFLGLCLYIMDTLTGNVLTLDQIFSAHSTNIHTIFGWVTILSFFLTSFTGAICLMYVVERAKKCLDFAATVYILHLLSCIIYNHGGIPKNGVWWFTNITTMIIMAVLGEYLCMRRELREIPISTNKSEVDKSIV